MSRFSDTLRAQSLYRNGQLFDGPPIGGALVLVTDFNTGQVVALEADDGSAIDNPIITNPDGTYYFNAPEGPYNLLFSYGGRVIGTREGIWLGYGGVSADVARLVNGLVPFNLPQEGYAPIPGDGTKLPYLSGKSLMVADSQE